MGSILPGKDDDRLVEAAALVMIGVMDAEDAAAQEGVTVAILMGYSSDPRTIKRFYELRDAGGIVAAKAIGALESAVNQISALIESGDLPPTVLLKATEVLHKVSGVDERRKRQSGPTEEPTSKATVIIQIANTADGAEGSIQGTAERVMGGGHE